MKIRDGFVSNSSSSSFMISIPARGGVSRSTVINRFKKAYSSEYESHETLEKEVLDFINKEYDRGYEVYYVSTDNEMTEDEIIDQVMKVVGGKFECIYL